MQPNTRQGSTQRDVNTNVVANSSAVAGVTTRSRALPIALGGRAITGDLFEPYNAVDEFENEGGFFQEESSMRVMYEDPGQRDEKKRLMNLLKAGGGEEDPLVGSSGGFGKRRRSVRIAGF